MLLRCSQGDLQRLVMPGQAFSELALLPDLAARRQTCTAIAGLATDLVALAGRDLEVACREHPQSGALVQVGVLLVCPKTVNWVCCSVRMSMF